MCQPEEDRPGLVDPRHPSRWNPPPETQEKVPGKSMSDYARRTWR